MRGVIECCLDEGKFSGGRKSFRGGRELGWGRWLSWGEVAICEGMA